MFKTKDDFPFRNRHNYKPVVPPASGRVVPITDQTKNIPMRKVIDRYRATGDFYGMILRKPVFDHKTVEEAMLSFGRVPPHRRRNLDLSDLDLAADRARSAIEKAKADSAAKAQADEDKILQLEAVADKLEEEAEAKNEDIRVRADKARKAAVAARKSFEGSRVRSTGAKSSRKVGR